MVLIAPTSFKGTLTAVAAADIIAEALLAEGLPAMAMDSCPLSDGGDDTLLCLIRAKPEMKLFPIEVMGPLPTMKVSAQVGLLPGGKTAVIEAAQAHGLMRLSQDQNGERVLSPMTATSYGVGQLILQVDQAFDSLQEIVVTLGGSASTDGGAGALQALGWRFKDSQGHLLEAPIGGASLGDVASIEPGLKHLKCPKLLIATDVLNPLLGASGTAAVYAPQKGANPEQVHCLAENLANYARLMQGVSGKDLTALPRTGAAGGLGYGLAHLASAGLISGFDWYAAQCGLNELLANAMVVISGEGRLDSQSLSGKTIGSLIKLLDRPNPPHVLLLCGSVTPELTLPAWVKTVSLIEISPNSLQHPAAALQQAVHWALGQGFFNSP